MAKSNTRHAATAKSHADADKPFVAIDKKAFDPTIASLFASSVRIHLPRQTPLSSITGRKC
ncbi:hypothetical protein BCR34DRAFT_560226 [Clohesyomyces aquaticus]|uniref:Uncharacterized protein n=1 Tax=Clohesyomyces aquaticus TaxID=1231657 RepID=A0A1Y1ZWG7_9PLEO|nr:hypothetical protein BCR34DRAFT_560226 [Clohesyomyces aquaticus]